MVDNSSSDLTLAAITDDQPFYFSLDSNNALKQYIGTPNRVQLNIGASGSGNQYPLISELDANAAVGPQLTCLIGSFVASTGGYAFTCTANSGGSAYTDWTESLNNNQLYLSPGSPDKGYVIVNAVVFESTDQNCQ